MHRSACRYDAHRQRRSVQPTLPHRSVRLHPISYSEILSCSGQNYTRHHQGPRLMPSLGSLSPSCSRPPPPLPTTKTVDLDYTPPLPPHPPRLQVASKTLSDKAACIDVKISAVDCLAAAPDSFKAAAALPVALKAIEATPSFRSGMWALAEAVGRCAAFCSRFPLLLFTPC